MLNAELAFILNRTRIPAMENEFTQRRELPDQTVVQYASGKGEIPVRVRGSDGVEADVSDQRKAGGLRPPSTAVIVLCEYWLEVARSHFPYSAPSSDEVGGGTGGGGDAGQPLNTP